MEYISTDVEHSRFLYKGFPTQLKRLAKTLGTLLFISISIPASAQVSLNSCEEGSGKFLCTQPTGQVLTLEPDEYQLLVLALAQGAEIELFDSSKITQPESPTLAAKGSSISEHFSSKPFVVTFSKGAEMGGKYYEPFYIYGEARADGIYFTAPLQKCSGTLYPVDRKSLRNSKPFYGKNSRWYRKGKAEHYQFPESCALHELTILDRGSAMGRSRSNTPYVRYYHRFDPGGSFTGTYSDGLFETLQPSEGQDLAQAAAVRFVVALEKREKSLEFDALVNRALASAFLSSGSQENGECSNEVVMIPDARGVSRARPIC